MTMLPFWKLYLTVGGSLGKLNGLRHFSFDQLLFPCLQRSPFRPHRKRPLPWTFFALRNFPDFTTQPRARTGDNVQFYSHQLQLGYQSEMCICPTILTRNASLGSIRKAKQVKVPSRLKGWRATRHGRAA